MDFKPILSSEQKSWLSLHGFELDSFIARGMCSGVWLVKKNGEFFAAKMAHRKSRRFRMTEKEALHLQMANVLGVGPHLIEFDADSTILVMDFVKGIPLATWLNKNNSKKLLKKLLIKVFAQARTLDKGKLDHGQLGGKLHNILVDTKNNPHIIDFEKASYVRAPKNMNALVHTLLSGHTGFSVRIREMLSEEDIQAIRFH